VILTGESTLVPIHYNWKNNIVSYFDANPENDLAVATDYQQYKVLANSVSIKNGE